MRSRAAPIGIRVTVSADSVDRTGLGWTSPIRPSESGFQFSIFRALVRISSGAAWASKGWLSLGQLFWRTSNWSSSGLLGVDHQAVVPGGGRVDLEGGPRVRSTMTDVLLADLERVGQGPSVDRDRVAVANPVAKLQRHRQRQLDGVARSPLAVDDEEGARLGVDHGLFAVDPQRRLFAPAGDAQVQRELHELGAC